MAISFVNSATAGGNATTINLTWPTVAAGDCALILWSFSDGFTSTTPTGFSLKQQVDRGVNQLRMEFWRKVCSGSESGALALTCSGTNRHSASLVIYRGTHATEPVDTWTTQNEGSSDTAHGCAQVTTGHDYCVIVSGVGERGSSGTTNYTTSYTERADTGSLAAGPGLFGTSAAMADDGLATIRAAGSAVTPPDWNGSLATTGVITWSISLRPIPELPPRMPPPGARQAPQRAASW